MKRAAAVGLAALCGACIFPGGARGKRAVPAAAPAAPAMKTAGDAILHDVPAGADIVIELDLARLYANGTVGAIAHRTLAGAGGDLRVPGLALPRGAAPLDHASLIVMAAYAVGTADATSVTFVVTSGEVPNGTPIGGGVVVLAPPAAVAHVVEVAAGRAPSVAGDAKMMALRARAMPAGAPGATVRATARLGLDARIALAPVLGPDLAPASLSLWSDVVDDAALVAILDGHDAAGGGGERLQLALERVRVSLAGVTSLLQIGLAPVIRDARIQRHGDVVEVVATIGPHRLGEVASRLAAAMGAVVVAPAPPGTYPARP